MGADIKSLRTRIKSVNSTLHLTKAMGLVASSKIRRAQENMNRSRGYYLSLKKTVNLLSKSSECKKSPYMQKRKGKRTRLVVVAGDRGLAGGYNANVFRLVREFSDAEIIPVGKRATDRFAGTFHSAESFSYKDAREISEKLCYDFKAGKFDRFGIVSTEYISMMKQEAKIQWVLPLQETEKEKGESIIFEPDEISVLNMVIYEYVAGMIFARVKESFASEIAARRVAMDSAGKNAKQMIDDLGLRYNRARQGAITQEITEIVAGSGI